MFYNILEQKKKQCYKLLAQLVPQHLEHNEIITSSGSTLTLPVITSSGSKT